MPEFTGRLRTPRLAAAPSSPVVGEMYFDTVTNLLYFWNGTVWTAGGAVDVFEQPGDPGAAAGVGDIWIDTDDPAPPAPSISSGSLAIANPMCVHKFGNPSGGASAAFTTTWEIYGTTVGDLGQSITATKNIWWEVDYWCLVATATAAYNRCDLQVWYDQGYAPDELGKSKGQFFSIYNHNAIGYQTIRATALLKCLAGRTYAVRGVLTAATGGTWTTQHHIDHVGSISKVVGYW